MRGIVTSMVVVTAFFGLTACSGDGGASGASASMSTTMAETTETTGTGSVTVTGSVTGSVTATGTHTDTDTDTGGEAAARGLPEGVSTWTGQGEIEGIVFGLDLTITNNGGDLTASAKLRDDPDAPLGLGNPEVAMSGTHEPSAGLVALAPNGWIVEPDVPSSLVGISAAHDPEAGTLSGMFLGFAMGSQDYVPGGALSLTRVDGAGAATIRGDESRSLAVGSQTFAGTLQCTGGVRDTTAELIFDGAGGLTGILTIGDPGLDAPLGAFAITGVHNPSTGGITLAPGLWTDDEGIVGNFYVDGTYDPGTGSFNGDQWTATASCPQGTWKTTIE